MSIIVNHLTYTYGIETPDEKRAINDVSFAIQDGEYIGLLGHTGSGKSTLVQLLTGLLTPQSGSVYYNGADIFDRDYDKKKLRSEVGLIFQYPEHQIFEVDDIIEDIYANEKDLNKMTLSALVKEIHAERLKTTTPSPEQREQMVERMAIDLRVKPNKVESIYDEVEELEKEYQNSCRDRDCAD